MKEVEFCDINIRIEQSNIRLFLQYLIKNGCSLLWKNDENNYILEIKQKEELHYINFIFEEGCYKIQGNYIFKETRITNLMIKILRHTKGNAIIKRFNSKNNLVIKNISSGEFVKIVKIYDSEVKMLTDDNTHSSSFIIENLFNMNTIEEKIAVLKLNMNYELMNLHEAITAGNNELVKKIKNNLKDIYNVLSQLEYF